MTATAKHNAESHDNSSVPVWLRELSEQERETYELIPAEIDCMFHESFEDKDAEQTYFGHEARQVDVPAWNHFPEVIDDTVTTAAKRTSLNKKDEQALFLQYNFARFTLGKLLEAQAKRKTANRAKQMVMWYRRALNARSRLVRANMALVLAMAKRTRIPNVEFSEMVSEGNMALLRSVEKFDVARGFKFSTYACRAILKSFNRLATKTGRYRQHFPTEFDPDLERSDYDVMKHEMQRDDSVEALREILSQNRAALSDVEQVIVMERFALGRDGQKGRTLAEVGKMVGLTNERVRQIQNLALGKIKAALGKDYLVA
ncbi:MAG: sigma-70 family RNA polymerase sigma factor [Phycisphaerae bacterium]